MMVPTNRRGVALLVVLLLLAVLGVVAAEVGEAARLEGNLVVTLRSRTVARYAAESGVLAATARVDALLDSVRATNERPLLFHRLAEYVGPLKDVDIGGARFSVVVSDLNARLDLNRAEPLALRAFFGQFTNQGRAETIVASLRSRPLGRMGEPEDVAYWVWTLVAPESRWTTGNVIHVDGGQVLGLPEAAGG